METFSTIENSLLLVKHFIKEDVTTSYILCYDPTFSCINYDKVKEPLPHLTIVMKFSVFYAFLLNYGSTLSVAESC